MHSNDKFCVAYKKTKKNCPNANDTFHGTIKDVALLGSHTAKIGPLLCPPNCFALHFVNTNNGNDLEV